MIAKLPMLALAQDERPTKDVEARRPSFNDTSIRTPGQYLNAPYPDHQARRIRRRHSVGRRAARYSREFSRRRDHRSDDAALSPHFRALPMDRPRDRRSAQSALAARPEIGRE